uniref:Putative TATE DNA transposons n=1 Tax=Leishmania guyanensis TaxID=5670 RepID=A0A1E1J9J9_LEIGU|nr:Putative TATE DNA transposons [Leishmania guyanensis]
MSSFGALTEESQLRMHDTITHLMREQKPTLRVSNHTQGPRKAPIIGADGSQVAALDMSSFGALTEESQLRMHDTITRLMREQKPTLRVSNHTQGPRKYQNSGRGVGFRGNYRGNGGGNRHGDYRGGEAQESFPSASKN